jgi:hypothetical protein
LLDVECIRDLLCLTEIRNGNEGIVNKIESDTLFLKLPRQPIVTVEVELEPKRCLGGHSQITKTQFFIDEVEVVV